MTRINLVPPQELMDQHLFAEFREIKMVPKSLRRSLEAAERRHLLTTDARNSVLKKIPPAYTLNTGHVSFFYDKGAYLVDRYSALKEELRDRGIDFNEDSPLDPDGVFRDLAEHGFFKNYEPTPEALELVRQRIAEKIALKPSWYRYRGVPNGSV